MTTFHNVRLPEDIEMGVRGGLGFMTTVLELADGGEQRIINWSKVKGRWDVSYGVRYKSDLLAVRSFHLARYGKAYGFRFKDWQDYVMPRQGIGTGNGVRTTFPIYKLYDGMGGYYFLRYLTRIVAGSHTLWINGVQQGISDYFLDVDTGSIVVPVAVPGGHVVEVACQFDVPVRFDIDRLEIQGLIAEDKDVTDTDEQDEGVEGLTAMPIVQLKE